MKKTVLITGANTGIGAATAERLARLGFRVFFACRSEAKTRPVMQAIAAATKNDDLHFLELALDDLASVRRCADAFLARGEPLHVLLLNAGLARLAGTTKQGFEPSFGVNHLGHFLLTVLLEPALKAGAPSRVVTVASRAHERVRRPLEESQLRGPSRSLTGWPEYERSKLANVLFTKELARRWAGTGVTAYALHPGVIASDLWRSAPWPLRPILTSLMKSPDEGSVASVRCATAPADELENGGYFGDRGEPRAVNPRANEIEAAQHLWALSEQWTTDFRT